jgi:hypothetical protein
MDGGKAVGADEVARDVVLGETVPRAVTDLAPEIEAFIAAAPNNRFLERQLDAQSGDVALPRFLHRFLVFNDALAARVPYLAGLIHLTPDLFLYQARTGFLGQANARVAAHVAAAAADEYRMENGHSMVHQHLSQIFFRSALRHCWHGDAAHFERAHPLPPEIVTLLAEARAKFFVAPDASAIFSALGFHVGLEFFANEEFNLVDRYLRERHPTLVAMLENGGEAFSDYTWLSLHTVVEIGHYRAGLEAVNQAVATWRVPATAPEMAERIMDGLRAFADLQHRYYAAVFAETP